MTIPTTMVMHSLWLVFQAPGKGSCKDTASGFTCHARSKYCCTWCVCCCCSYWCSCVCLLIPVVRTRYHTVHWCKIVPNLPAPTPQAGRACGLSSERTHSQLICIPLGNGNDCTAHCTLHTARCTLHTLLTRGALHSSSQAALARALQAFALPPCPGQPGGG